MTLGNVAIVGGAGFIGRHVVAAVHDAGGISDLTVRMSVGSVATC